MENITFDRAFFVEKGKKGGKKGGNTTKQRHGLEFFKTIGKMGGDKKKKKM